MIIIAMQDTDSKVTSDFLAASVGVNPVIIRKTLSQLKKAGWFQLLVVREELR